MTIREACEHIMGKELAASIIDDMGLHWCVVAAMADCKVSHGQECKATIQAYLDQQKQKV